ncbi:MAG: MBL fold hydrolase [Candidatus Schekmanbacteria bacterium RBG_16_38_10]|uniref:MBL fold hydrolase n=1 Tax=Candidatus Schekmanbacteria bacterium RBG_16_38_10 TaxID=1817879 RepID=A0A1F7RWA5_9BACT|nr:MAG: MBL fold hydrolase [Candidatus Schekmanbacteria bacterium RBG_16_38_10]
MSIHNVPEIAEGVYWVGSKDWNRKIFDSLIPLHQGTSYNSYLVKGKERIALIDTVNPGFEKEFTEKLSQLTDIKNINYLIMNHAEPDHSNAIPLIMEMSNATLITSEKGFKMAQVYYNIPEERIKKVKDNDTIDLGGKTLKFIDAPWLHWPETMFTYLVENGILFSCDFFGAHSAAGLYDSDVDEIISYAKGYFGEIMMPYKNMGKKAIDKIENLGIKMIAPSHGPIYRNPERILEVYRKWTVGETKEKAILAYVSMWSATERMIKTMAETLLSENIDVKIYNLAIADFGSLAADLVDSRAIVLGAPVVLGGMHPVAVYGALLVKALKPPLKYGAVISSYGWGGAAIKQALEILGPTKIEVVGTHEINGPPTPDDHQKVTEIAKQLAGKIKQ